LADGKGELQEKVGVVGVGERVAIESLGGKERGVPEVVDGGSAPEGVGAAVRQESCREFLGAGCHEAQDRRHVPG
jgi:hypothetical protein